MRKASIILMTLIAAALSALGQNGLNSPYSQFGVGVSDAPYNSPFAYSRGAVLSRGGFNYINTSNPATYALIESQNFVMDMGLGVQMNKLKDKYTSQFDADGVIGYVAVGFPLAKWWKTVLSVQPYSDVSYQLTVPTSDPATYGKMKTLYEGNGGVNRFTWGHAFNIGSRVSLGFNLHLLYGNITRAITYDFEAADTTFFVDSRRQQDTRVLKFSTDFGLLYRQPIGEKYSMNIGLTLQPSIPQNVKDKALVYTFVESGGNEYMRDTIFPYEGQSAEFKSKVTEAWTAGLGLTLERNDRWLVSLDGVWAQWSGMQYEEGLEYKIFGEQALRYGNYFRIAAGFEWLGDQQASKYWQRIGYSAGIRYENGKLNLDMNNNRYGLDEIGCGIGVKLPMRKGRSLLNVAFGYSRFGSADLLTKDCYTIGVSFSSCESWFVKRKYN